MFIDSGNRDRDTVLILDHVSLGSQRLEPFVNALKLPYTERLLFALDSKGSRQLRVESVIVAGIYGLLRESLIDRIKKDGMFLRVQVLDGVGVGIDIIGTEVVNSLKELPSSVCRDPDADRIT